MELDRDLLMIQEVRNLVREAEKAQKILAEMTQEKINEIVAAMCEAGAKDASRLASFAVEETGIGRKEDKVLKNLFATQFLYEQIRDMKTAGIVSNNREKGIIEIAVPMGVVAAVTPTTNPTSTALNNAIICIKSRNAMVLSPHPRSKKCTFEALETVRKAAILAGAPEGCLGCITDPGIAATDELMKNEGISVIIATGGPGIVKAAYSSGKPAFGVGAGNAPCYIEKSADIQSAAKTIIMSKSFDNSTICASEQSILCDSEICDKAQLELQKYGGYFMTEEERLLLEKILLSPNNTMIASSVGRSAEVLAQMAGFSVPKGTLVLIGEIQGIGTGYPLSHEKLSPVLAYYKVKDWEDACSHAIKLLELGGLGHTMVLHSMDEKIIMEFANRKPAMRILVNTASSLGGVGGTTALFPALTLGCGTGGGNIISDNLGPQHLVNHKRLAYGNRSMEALRDILLSGTFFEPFPASKTVPNPFPFVKPARPQAIEAGISEEELVRKIVEEVYKKLEH